MTCTQPCFSEKPATEASIEDIILRHSVRGMDLLRPYLDEHYCLRAARQGAEDPSRARSAAG